MKKYMILVMLIVLLTGCKAKDTEDIVLEVNQHSNFTYDLLTEVTSELTSAFQIIEGFGIRTLIDPTIDLETVDFYQYIRTHETTYYDVTAYPDHASGGQFITSITTTDPHRYVYELSVGDTYTSADLDEYMASIDFYPHEDIELLYERERVTIRVSLSEGVIIHLSVSIIVTNKDNIVF